MCNIAAIIYLFLVLLFYGFTLNAYHSMALYCVIKRCIRHDHSVYFYAAAKSLQSCLTLCDPIESSPLASPIPGILQARTLEWVVISFSNA